MSWQLCFTPLLWFRITTTFVCCGVFRLGDDAFAQLVEQDSHPLAEPQRRTVMASDEQIGDERQDGAIDWLWVLQQDRKLNKRMHCINSQLATVRCPT